MRFNCCSALMGFILLLFFSTAQAGVVVGGTRVIFNGEKKEASISVDNPDNEPYLIQSWLDNQQSGVDKIAFIITPPLFRLDGHQENMLRIVRVGDDLPKDKESLYWMNIKSIPSTEHTGKSNTLQIAVKNAPQTDLSPCGAAQTGSRGCDSTVDVAARRQGIKTHQPHAVLYEFSLCSHRRARNERGDLYRADE